MAPSSRSIPLVNLRRNYDTHRDSYERILRETAAGCDFILGRKVGELEERFADYLGVEHVVGVGSGTDALAMILKALRLPPGSAVLTQANTFVATTLAIHTAGLEILLTDCDARTGEMSLENYSGPEPAVVMPVHLFGYPTDLRPIRERFGEEVLIVEDAAQAHGAMSGGKRCGALGVASGFSFYPGKNLGAFGDGGAVATDDADLATEVRFLGNWGATRKYVHEREGGNSRLDNIQAAILEYKLRHLDEWNGLRNEHASRYRQLLSGLDGVETLPDPPAGSSCVWHLFPVLVPAESRDRVLEALHADGVGAGIHYPIPIHRQVVYAGHPIAAGRFPNAESRAERMISLPLFPELEDEEIVYVCERLAEALS